jgi:hypothetical protein
MQMILQELARFALLLLIAQLVTLIAQIQTFIALPAIMAITCRQIILVLLGAINTHIKTNGIIVAILAAPPAGIVRVLIILHA